MQTQNTGVTSQNLGVVEKPSVSVKILSWILLLVGILYIYLILLPFEGSFGGGDVSSYTFVFGSAGSVFITSIVLIVSSFGIRRMRRWAFYTIMTLFIFNMGIFFNTVTDSSYFSAYSYYDVLGSIYILLVAVFQLFTLIYLGTINRRFK